MQQLRQTFPLFYPQMLSLGIPNTASNINNTSHSNSTTVSNSSRKRESDEDFKHEFYNKVQRGKKNFFLNF